MVVGALDAGEKSEGVGAGCGVFIEIEGERAASGAFAETADEFAVGARPVGAERYEKLGDLLRRECAEASEGAARADGGKKLSGVFGKQNEMHMRGWLFKEFEKRVRGFLHE